MPKKPKKLTTAAIEPVVETLDWERGRLPRASDVARRGRLAAAKVPDLVARAAAAAVENVDDHKDAIVLLGEVKCVAAELDDVRKLEADPFRHVLEAVNGYFRPWIKDLAAAEEDVKTKAQTWFLEQRRRAREEEERQRQAERDAQAEVDRKAAKAAADHAAAHPGATPRPPPAPAARIIPRPTPQPLAPTVRASSSSGTMRVKHKARLANLEAVSRDYLMIDWKAVEAKVKQLERNLGSVPADAIPGFEVYEDANMAVGRGR